MPPTTTRYFEAMTRRRESRLLFAVDELADLKRHAEFVGMHHLAERLGEMENEIASMICRLESVAREVSIADEIGRIDAGVESELVAQVDEFIYSLDKIG